ncbi:MAG: DUF1538 domain-containing protein [Bacilli bacterium]|nr:DUF1538 domain-containing protein [Bacilli bacterium]
MSNGIFTKSFLNAIISSAPVFLLVEILNIFNIFSFVSFEKNILFFGSFLFLVIGITFFSIGIEHSINKIGQYIGSSIIERKNILLLIIVCFLIGLFATIAEPDLMVLASQLSIKEVYLFLFLVGIGVGLFLVIGVFRILFKYDLKILLLLFYGIIFTLINLINKSFIPIIFDSGGMTTGPITVPLILSLGLGVSKSTGNNSDSFGLSSFCSLGPLFILPFFTHFIKFQKYNSNTIVDYGSLKYILLKFSIVFREVLLSIIPIIVFFFIYNFIFLKLPKKNIFKIIVGIVYVYFGLSLFLAGVEIGFVPIAEHLGYLLISKSKLLLFIISGIIGFTITLCEPSVKVLINQIESVSNGAIKKRNMLITLSLSISLAVILSVIRVVCDFSVLYYIVPGYILAMILSCFTPNIYFGIAFDSGGVTSGSLSSAFILPFIIGVANYTCLQKNYGLDFAREFVLKNAFGVISLIALAPLIVIQIFGLVIYIANHYNNIVEYRKMHKGEDNQIIKFYE